MSISRQWSSRILTLSLLLLLLPWSRSYASQTVLRYDPSGSDNWLPYYIVNQKRTGILGELIPAILHQAKINGTQIILPPKRTIEALNKGELDFDIISPNWFPNQDVGSLFLLSKPLFMVKEHYILLPDSTFSAKRIDTEPIGTVRGYFYHNDGEFIRQDYVSEKELIIALHKRRISYAICGDLPARYWSKQLQLETKLGPVHSSGWLHIRLRKDKQLLLPRINQAIDKIKQQGLIQKIIDKYTKKNR